MRPLSVCVVGGGPAAFYISKYILKSVQPAVLHMFERLPVPFGLARFGVAPDHPEVKLVVNELSEIANQPGFQFFGNVTIGKDISVDSLKQHYHLIVFACGASLLLRHW